MRTRQTVRTPQASTPVADAFTGGSARLGAVLCALVLFIIAPGSASHAADIVVNSLGSDATDDAVCTLREAVHAANLDIAWFGCSTGNGWDRITFSVTGTLVPGDELDILGGLSIIGPGASTLTLDGEDQRRHFVVANESTLLLAGLTLTRGFSASGGAIEQRSGAVVTIVESTFSHNLSSNGAGAIAVWNRTGTPSRASHLRIERSQFLNNTSQGPAGGGAIRVGALESAVIEDSTFAGNRAEIAATSVSSGGAILAYRSTLSILRSTLSGNWSQSNGGAVAFSFDSKLDLLHSTVVGNTALDNGGGLRAFGSTPAMQEFFLSMKNSVVADNNAPSGPNIHMEGPGDTVSLATNWISNNSGAELALPVGNPNAEGDYVGSTGAVLNADLAALGDNGGWTETHEPNTSSDLIDAGACEEQGFDQRGYSGANGRAAGAGCDIGAVEFGADSSGVIFVANFESGVHHRWSSSSP